MIEISNVSKTFITKDKELQALKNVSLRIEEGTIHGIIGPSGAGKSTLIRTVNLLEIYDSGNISVFGYQDVKKLNRESTRMLRKEMGMIFQGFNLFDQKTVLSNVLFPISIIKKITEEDKKRALELLTLVGLNGYDKSYPNQLSGGQKQRVGIARALINNPKILLCDEPTSALDTTSIKSILALLKELKEKLSLTIVVVTHDMNVIKDLCDYVTVMELGEVVETDTIDNIIFNPKHDVTKALLDTTGFNLDLLVSKFQEYPNLMLLRFSTAVKQQSIISNISIELKQEINILYANITPKEHGIMLVSVDVKDMSELQKLNNLFSKYEVGVRYV